MCVVCVVCVVCVRSLTAIKKATDITAKSYPRRVCVFGATPARKSGSMGYKVTPPPSCGQGHGECFHSSNIGS